MQQTALGNMALFNCKLFLWYIFTVLCAEVIIITLQ